MRMETFHDYRVRWWLKQSSMAVATGLVLGYMAIPFLAFLITSPFGGALIGAVVGFVAFQVSALKQLRGGRRGAIEYAHREAQIESRIESIRLTPADITDDILLLDFSGAEAFLNILKDRRTRSDDETFIIYMGAARGATRFAEDRKAIELLHQAVQLKPHHLVANFRLAEAFERTGAAKEAIEAYRSALTDPSIQSRTLEAFVMSQVERVKTRGPNRRSQYYGLRYLGLGA
jgi:tetratricopeptide (TPR) repeat protein